MFFFEYSRIEASLSIALMISGINRSCDQSPQPISFPALVVAIAFWYSQNAAGEKNNVGKINPASPHEPCLRCKDLFRLI